MKKYLTLALLLAVSVCYAQNIEILNKIGDKQGVTINDVTLLFSSIDKSLIPDQGRSKRLFKAVIHYQKHKTPITKGAAAYITVKYLNIHSSLMFNIIPCERYAFRVCVAEGLFSRESNTAELLSGSELLELSEHILKRYGVE